MKRICILGLVLILLFTGCMKQPEQSLATSDSNDAIMEENRALHFSSLEDYQKYGPRNNPFDYVTYPRNFVFYENIRDLGSFVFFHSYTYEGGNPVYVYRLKDSNNVEFDLVINHEGLDSSDANLAKIPTSASSMVQVGVIGEANTGFRIESNGFLYRYKHNGILTSIMGEVNGIGFYIQPLVKGSGLDREYNFLDYPLDGERTLLSLLLSTSPSDHQAAMRMMRRCLPKTWVQYTLYCAVPVVILAVAAVLIYRKKRKARSPACAAPDAPEAPATPNYLDDPDFPDDPQHPPVPDARP